MPVSEVKLTRAQIEEIVGPDQRKVKALESVLDTAIILDEAVDTWWVTKWANGRIVLRSRITTTATVDTYTFPDVLSTDFLDETTMMGSSYGSATAEDITVKFSSLTETTVDIGATVNGVLSAVECSVTIESRWK